MKVGQRVQLKEELCGHSMLRNRRGKIIKFINGNTNLARIHFDGHKGPDIASPWHIDFLEPIPRGRPRKTK